MPQPILVLHGALGSAEQMQPIVDALRTIDGVQREVHAIDLPGHGKTPVARDEDFAVAHFADVAANAITALGLVRPLCFGYSMGGYVAVALESRAPNTFAGIVTLGTKFTWTAECAAREVRRLDAQKLREKVPQFAAMLEARHANAGGWERLLLRTAALLRSIGDAPSLTDQVLARVTIPTVIAVGTKDDTVTPDETSNAARVTGGQFVLLENVGHAIESVPASEVVSLMRRLSSSVA